MRPMIALATFAAMTLAGCGAGGAAADSSQVSQYVSSGAASTPNASVDNVPPGKPPVIASNVADPCTFFSKAEIELVFDAPFGPPKKGRDEPTCSFYNSNTGSVTVRAGEAVSRAAFDSLRTMLGAEAEPVSGIGETAYFWGPRIYVLKYGRQLVINVSTDQLTTQLRGRLSTLGMLGAQRLRP